MTNYPKRLFSMFLIVGGLFVSMLLISGSSKALEIDTVEGAKQAIENLVQEGLPGPVGEFITVLQNSPRILKFGLRGWLRKKMLDAIYTGNVDKFDKYLSFYSCITNKDCKGADKVQSQAKAAITPPSKAGAASRKAGTFKILQVFLPKTVKSGGKKGSLTVFWRGSPNLPITMVYRPRGGRCPEDVNCSKVKQSFGSEADPLIIENSVWCFGVTRNIYFDYEVLLRDASGNETAPYPAAFSCIRTGK